MPEVNPRAVIGSNTPDAIDYAKEESDRLQRDYAALLITEGELNAEADKIPEVLTLEHKPATVDLIKRFRDFKIRCEGLHSLEKQPHYRRGQGVDNFFFGIIDRVLKRDKKNMDGIGDVLNKRLTDLDVRLLAEENERRRLEAERLERDRQEAETKRLEQERIAQEAREAAERALKPHTQAAKEVIAEQAEETASAAAVEEQVITAKAEEAYVQTLAKPAEIMRSRTASGTTATMAQETFAEIESVNELDGSKLWQFVTFENKQKALLAWARSTDFREPMPGAKVGRRPKSRVR